jgi:hypothetical protein
MMLTNALSPLRAIELFHDIATPQGVIPVMSSEIGSIANCFGFWDLYNSSKAALNMLMAAFATWHPDETRALLLGTPGGFSPVNLPLFHGTRDGPVPIDVLMRISFQSQGDLG